MNAKKLVDELQAAIAANDGADMWVGLQDMDDYGKYGYAELVSTHTSDEIVAGMPTVVLTYN